MEDTKYYLCKFGLFYEGEELEKYCYNNNSFYYQENIILDKFIVHYYNNVPKLYFRFRNFRNKVTYTIPADQLGVFYKKIIKSC